MKVKLFLVLVLLFYGCAEPKAPAVEKLDYRRANGRPDSVYRYVNAAIDTMQKYSINKDKINWDTLRKDALDQSKGAKIYSDTYPVIKSALQKLKDNHSFFKTPEQAAAWKEQPKSPPKKDKTGLFKSLMTPGKRPVGVMRDGGIAELYISFFASGNISESLNYIRSIQDAIKHLDSENPKGWIIDLSNNYGGNMWPMLAALGPFLNPGIQGGFWTFAGTFVPWHYNELQVGAGKDVLLNFPRSYQLKNKNLPIGVFIGPRTASSGEGVIIALKNNVNVKTFGEPSAGLTTANESYTLMDGAELLLTSAIFTDKNGKLFGGKITPDVGVQQQWYHFGAQHYLMLKEVRKWVGSFYAVKHVSL